jgi:hypothetical protein
MLPPSISQAKALTMGTTIAAACLPRYRRSAFLPRYRRRCRRSRSRPAFSDKTTKAIMSFIMAMATNELTQRSGVDATWLQDVQGNAGTAVKLSTPSTE